MHSKQLAAPTTARESSREAAWAAPESRHGADAAANSAAAATHNHRFHEEERSVPYSATVAPSAAASPASSITGISGATLAPLASTPPKTDGVTSATGVFI